MQDQLVEVELPNGAVALAQVAMLDGVDGEAPDGAMKTGAFADNVIEKFDFSGVGRTLDGLSQAVKAALVTAAPDKVTVQVELGLAVKNGELTGLFAKGEVEGSLAVTLEWDGGGAS